MEQAICHQAVRVQARIKTLCEKAVYTHCSGHNLSLVVTGCKLPVIRNVLDKVQEVIQMFIKGSKKKKMKLLEEVVKEIPHYSSQKVIFNVCIT